MRWETPWNYLSNRRVHFIHYWTMRSGTWKAEKKTSVSFPNSLLNIFPLNRFLKVDHLKRVSQISFRHLTTFSKALTYKMKKSLTHLSWDSMRRILIRPKKSGSTTQKKMRRTLIHHLWSLENPLLLHSSRNSLVIKAQSCNLKTSLTLLELLSQIVHQ